VNVNVKVQSARRRPNGRRAPVSPSVKFHNAQGPHELGGAINYIDNGEMTQGFALIAWPAEYGSTGLMTFLANKVGIVCQKDLGPETAAVASKYATCDPDDARLPSRSP
jgi:hypothetical protein